MPCLTAYVDHLYDYHITTTIKPIDRANIEAERYGTGMDGCVSRVRYRFDARVEDAHDHLRGSAVRSTPPMVVTIGIACTHTEIAFLDVSPEDICWITPDMGIIYEVTSNVDWAIKY